MKHNQIVIRGFIPRIHAHRTTGGFHVKPDSIDFRAAEAYLTIPNIDAEQSNRLFEKPALFEIYTVSNLSYFCH